MTSRATSPGPGSGSGSSAARSGCPGASSTIARMDSAYPRRRLRPWPSEDYREASLRIWEEMAAGWEGHRGTRLGRLARGRRVAGGRARPSAWGDGPRARGRRRRHRLRRRPPARRGGKADHDGLLGADGAGRAAARRRARHRQCRVQDPGRRAHGPRRRQRRRRAVPLGLHAHGGPGRGARGDPARTGRRRAGGALGLGRPGAEPVGVDPGTSAARADRCRAAGPPRPRDLRHGERGAHSRPARAAPGSSPRGSRPSRWRGGSTRLPTTGIT